MTQWLIIVSWVAVILGLLTALAIAFDITARPQPMKIMNVVWPIHRGVAFGTPLGTCSRAAEGGTCAS